MSEWEIVFLPSFQADLEKYQPNQEKLDKWFLDLQKKPDYINNAHPLHGPQKPLWSAHFNVGVNYVIIYLLCNGNPDRCFLKHQMERFDYIDRSLVEHICNNAQKKIYVCRMGTHRTYKEL